jgi:hypothetical protein
MRFSHAATVVLGALLLTGCTYAGAGPFQGVDLTKDLSPQTMERYRTEMAKVHEAGQSGHMMVLEHTDWWPLGILAYWKKGKVEGMHSDSGVNYMVSKSLGYGPLAILFNSKEQAAYSSTGVRQTYMKMDGFHHFAMFHTMGSKLDDGSWMEHQSAGYMMHLINTETDSHGGTSVSLLSNPNPITFGK